MANLSIKDSFKATHGTEDVRESDFQVEVEVKGNLTEDFVGGIDYNYIKNSLQSTIRRLQDRYLDEIVGRGTLENIACLFMFDLKFLKPSKVSVSSNNVEVSIFYGDARWENYSPLLHFKIGSSKMVRGLCLEALTEFDKVLEFNPNLPEVINCRGRAYKHLKRFDLAIKNHSRAIELSSNFGEAYRNRGNDHYSLGNFDVMIPDFNKAIELMPLSALAYNNRGFALQYFGRYEEAIKDHSKAIELNQTYAEAYEDRAKALKAIGKNYLASIDEERAKSLVPLQNKFNLEWKKITWPSLGEDGLKFLAQPA